MCKPDDERILVYTVRCIQGPFELHINQKTHRVYVRKINWATADDKKSRNVSNKKTYYQQNQISHKAQDIEN
jgi:hypothetical protein